MSSKSAARVTLACAGLLAQLAHAGAPSRIVLPPHLPAACIAAAAADYALPPEILLAIIKVESGGRSVVSRNANGSMDYGVAQHNTGSWVPYFERRYNIPRQSLIDSPCQSVRAQAYALRTELNHRECRGADLWCAVGRYHSPGSAANRAIYVPKVKAALTRMLATGRFDAGTRRAAQPTPGASEHLAEHQVGHQVERAWSDTASSGVAQRIEFGE